MRKKLHEKKNEPKSNGKMHYEHAVKDGRHHCDVESEKMQT